ncbi:MAG: phosphoenolpyruvate--protein phosphotransferase, partial [Cellulomonadaceae bacterium]|nr:phosphoenolpyruvate--protein phosphotransferase [Cellulomonadaceae bacterium]
MSEQATLLQGVGVGRGAVWGPVARVRPAPVVPADEPVAADPEAAKERISAVFGEVAAGLRAQAAGATGTVAEVLSATAQMADDRALRTQALGRIDKGEPPLHAVVAVVAEFAAMFTAAGGYLAERVTDLVSVRDRVVARYAGLAEPGVPPLERPSVIVADDLSPADTAALDLTKVLGIVIEQGGPTGHTAIIAGQLGLPCVVRATGASALADGDEVAIDAAAGTVTLAPDDATKARVAARREALAALAENRADGATADGHAIALLANIGTAEDAERLTDAAVEGVGLFRTEVLFLGAATAPTEDAQAGVYSRALTALGGRKVVIRTLDAGADKPLAFVTRPGEENPALGVRGYRLVRAAKELMDTQLAAIARAAKDTGTEPWVMAPMIA